MSISKWSGFSLLEVTVALGLTSAMAAVGFTTSRELLPRFRTRKAAAEYADAIQLARQLAITTNRETRVLMVEYDGDPEDPGVPNRGLYRIQMGDSPTGATSWDTLPLDSSGDALTGEGTVDISRDGNCYLKGVSIEDWGTLDGPGSSNADAIVFSPRGVVLNPASDFNDDGSLTISFINKYSTGAAGFDRAYVKVFRGGMIRMANNRNDIYGASGGGVAFSSTVDGSTGDGYTDPWSGSGGGGGGSDDAGSGGDGSASSYVPRDSDEDIDETIDEAIDALYGGDDGGDDDGDDEDDDSSGAAGSSDEPAGSDEDGGDEGGGGDDDSDDEKVAVCHSGNTLNISRSALSAHLNHGDTEGACDTDDSSRDHGSRDHGSRDHGSRDHGSRDHGSRDDSSRDHGSRDDSSRDHGSRDRGGHRDGGSHDD
jgi:type II secretory pathway pseudopilin PulG